ncbi:MAG: sulfatase/phosphatase domain-containing protein [Planctomycetota bacterium]|jgi:arylsulfatase A-like enzyme
MVPVLKGRQMDRGPIYWHYPHYGNQGGAPGSAIRQGRWKLIEWFEDGRLELYDLANDIGEKNNLADKHPDIVKRLHNKLIAWRKEVNAKYPSPNPNAK